MNRRSSIYLALLLSVGWLTGCTSTRQRQRPLVNPQRRPHLPLVRFITPDSQQVAPLLQALRSELAPDFDVLVSVVGEGDDLEKLRKLLAGEAPVAVVLVDNPTAALYAKLAKKGTTLPPAILVMSSFVREVQRAIPNSTAIAFEPPAVVTLSHLRSLLGGSIQRAGVVYREGFESFFDQERQRARVEEIELIGVAVPARPSVNALGRALHELESASLDAVWVTNDNALLTRQMLTNAWLPFSAKSHLPIVVGVPALIAGRDPLGTYAAVPDLEGLGLQTAEIVYQLQANGWDATTVAIQPAYSLKTYLNLRQARLRGVTADSAQRVDIVYDD